MNSLGAVRKEEGRMRRKVGRNSQECAVGRLSGGAGGIRTLGTAFQPYNGLANRRFRPLSHRTSSIESKGEDSKDRGNGKQKYYCKYNEIT